MNRRFEMNIAKMVSKLQFSQKSIAKKKKRLHTLDALFFVKANSSILEPYPTDISLLTILSTHCNVSWAIHCNRCYLRRLSFVLCPSQNGSMLSFKSIVAVFMYHESQSTQIRLVPQDPDLRCRACTVTGLLELKKWKKKNKVFFCRKY